MKKNILIYFKQKLYDKESAKGAIFVITVCLIVLMAAIIVTCLARATTGYKNAYLSAESMHGLNLAESGVEYVIWASRAFNGIPGGRTTNTVSGSTLTDTGRSWTANCWTVAGRSQLRILSGTASGQTFTISSNTSTAITCSASLTSAGVANGDKYAILFTGTLVDGTYTAYYDPETTEIISLGDVN